MDNNLQKFKSLVEIAKIEYQDELNRNTRLEEKVGKFLMVQSIIIIAFIYLMLSSITWSVFIKVHIVLQSIFVFFNVLFIFLTLSCICDCLKAFQLNNFKRYELGDSLEDLAFDEDENLISMYWQVYQAYKECLKFNTKLIEEKGKYITSALSSLLYCCILFTVVTFMTFLGYIGLAYDNQSNPNPIIIQLKCEKRLCSS
ncbi:hypothetical protein [Acinetobacter courvalinii]|uniref:hypothetical protein n=1 Tax=Acinetobacter courvalinii TaxID=280147 RepID=UPI0002CFFB16|nr:hypothetical protein [Acinetobacter courvalinii]ENX07803.1 hypothetical protein F898_01325 [Acinetobacter courvalinii]